MAGEVLVDCLPYIDQGYDEPGVKEAVLSMVEEETKRYRPTKNYLEILSPSNSHFPETDMMKVEYERLQNCQPMEPFNMKRYELPPPQKKEDLNAWSDSIHNSMAQLEHQETRITNLELMLKYGPECWKLYNQTLVTMLRQSQKQILALRQQIQETNWQRKSSQTASGEKLKNLEASWVGLVSKNYEIERACAELEESIAKLEPKTSQPLNDEPEPMETSISTTPEAAEEEEEDTN